jgi:dTDP-glucose 4,6-dehydratase
MVEALLKKTDWEIVVLDCLTYAARGFERLRDINCFRQERVQIFTGDVSLPISEGVRREMGALDYILHMAAETHVDNSISDPAPFVRANVIGTMNMLEFARVCHPEKFVYFSTDEVFGPAPEGAAFKEWDRYNSTNPYSASKAAGEELCLAWANTYRVPVVISHCMNVFGERQHPEKFLPMVINKVLRGEIVTIHSHPNKQRSGSRFYIHARNVADAVLFLLDRAEVREKYNIVGEREVSNLEMAQRVAKIVGKPLRYEMVDFHSARPGHDLRYALDGTKLCEMGWNIPMTFEDSMAKTVRWTLNNPRWLE